MGNLLKRVIGFIFLLLLSWIGQALLYPFFEQAMVSKDWEEITATVLQNRMKSNLGEKGNLYQLDFVYRYHLNGTTYEGKGRYYDLGEPRQSWKGKIPDFVSAFPVGSTITAYYNPLTPSQATIKRGFLLQHYCIALAFTVFVLMTLHLILHPEKWIWAIRS